MIDFDVILTRLPSLKNLLDSHGSMSLFEYAQKYYSIHKNISHLAQERKGEILDFLDGYVTKKFGKKSAEIVVSALSKNYAVSTAEHHGPMGHPFFFQSALLRAVSQSELPVINFATSHVSLGNSSYPRGLVFHGDGEKAPIEYLHLPFFGSKSRMCPVFDFPAYTRNDIVTHCIGRLKAYKRLGYISEPLYTKIYDFIQEHVLETSILALSMYSEQITLLNHRWWKSLFPTLPVAFSLDAEDIVVQLLQQHLQEDTFFAQILTDISLQPRIEEQFNGISCCFHLEKHSGTYLFWYLDEHHKRHALWREGDELVSQDKNFRIRMTHESYSHHLEQRHLIPSGLLVYSMLTCYYGVTCFGGFAQGDYLPAIQKALSAIWGNESGGGIIQLPILNEDMVFLFEKNGAISTTLDMYTQKGQNFDCIGGTQSTSLLASMYKMQDEIRRCL